MTDETVDPCDLEMSCDKCSGRQRRKCTILRMSTMVISFLLFPLIVDDAEEAAEQS